MFEFAWPWLFLLLPAPWLVYRLYPPAAKQQAALRVPFYGKLSETTPLTRGQGTNPLRLAALGLIWCALVTAAAQPQWAGDPVQLPTRGRDLMLAVDLSGSMATEDLTLNGKPANRLMVIKDVLNHFIKERRGDRIGLILFGTQAYLQSPLTFDRKTVQTLLDQASIAMAGQQTAIGDAIGLAIKQLRKRPQDERVLILLTDGANNAGNVSPDKAAELAAESHIKIYTVGVGSDEMVEPGLFGGLFGSRSINPSQDLDEKALQKIAKITGGRYFRAKSSDDLKEIYGILDKLEPVKQQAEFLRPIKTLFFWPLAVAMLASMLLATTYIYRFRERRL